MYGRYTGLRPLAVAWTALALVALAVVLPEYRPLIPVVEPALSLATEPARERRVGAVAAVWLVVVAALWVRERRHWRWLADRTSFVPQGDASGTHPPYQATVRSRTVTATASTPGLVSRVHTVVRTSVDGLQEPVRVRIRYVGGDASDEGLSLGNPALDDRFVVASPTPTWLRRLLTPEIQSVLMDVETPGELRVTERAVAYEVPSTRLSAAELGQCAVAVATLGNRLSKLGG